MLLITLSWIYILFTTVNLGFCTDKIIGLKNNQFVITILLGLFTTTVLASIWAVFGRINIEFHGLLFILNVITIFRYKIDISNCYRFFWNDFKMLSRSLRLYLIVICVFIISQCSSIPYVIDNESYYIQTIKWLNEYGLVKGLVNLHLFLGQMSGWHIAQSTFNFSFLYPDFNDLSGFCLILGNLFAVQKLNEYFTNKRKAYLVIGLFPIASVFFFQFISAPSPDIPVYVLSFIIFFYFLENFKNTSVEVFNLIVILTLFVLYIKNTSIVLVMMPFILWIQNFKALTGNLLKPLFISLLILGLFITKNMIVCGSPFFPTKLFTAFQSDYTIPDSIEGFYYNQLKYYGYFTDMNQYNSMSVFDLFSRWLTLPKLNGLFNKTNTLLVLISPIIIYRFFNQKKYWILYSLMLSQFIVLFATSPQYRFFINFTLLFSLLAFAGLVYQQKTINIILWVSLIPVTIILFFPFDLNQFSENKFMMKISNFSPQNIVFPHQNSKYSTSFQTLQTGNLQYNSPSSVDFFWGSGNGNLPCVNKAQIDYFKTYFYIIPQMRTNDLKDGFYAKTIIPNE